MLIVFGPSGYDPLQLSAAGDRAVGTSSIDADAVVGHHPHVIHGYEILLCGAVIYSWAFVFMDTIEGRSEAHRCLPRNGEECWPE